MIKPSIITALALAASLVACDSPPSVSFADQALTGITVLPATGWGAAGVTATPDQDGSVTWCCTTWFVQLPLGVGDTIGSLTVPVRDNGAANGFATSGNNVVIAVLSQSPAGTVSLGSASSNGSGNAQTLVVTLGAPRTLVAGESLVLRAVALSGGAIPGAAQHPSFIGAISIPPVSCARVSHVRKLVPFAGQSIGSGLFQARPENFAGIWQPIADGDFLGVPLPVESGERMDAMTVEVFGSIGWTVRAEVFAMTGTDSIPESLGAFDSALVASDQSGTIALAESVDDGRRAYWVQFVGHSVSGSGFKPRVGPMALRTSGPAPGCAN